MPIEYWTGNPSPTSDVICWISGSCLSEKLDWANSAVMVWWVSGKPNGPYDAERRQSFRRLFVWLPLFFQFSWRSNLSPTSDLNHLICWISGSCSRTFDRALVFASQYIVVVFLVENSADIVANISNQVDKQRCTKRIRLRMKCLWQLSFSYINSIVLYICIIYTWRSVK